MLRNRYLLLFRKMKVTKYFYEDDSILRFLAWMKEYKDDKIVTGFVHEDTIYSVLLPSKFKLPAFVEARKIDEVVKDNRTVKLWKFAKYLQELSVPGIQVIHGIIVRKEPERITSKANSVVRVLPEVFVALTTAEKRICIATSFVDNITPNDFVELIVDTIEERDDKTVLSLSLRGVITRKLSLDEALSVIKKSEFGSLVRLSRALQKPQ